MRGHVLHGCLITKDHRLVSKTDIQRNTFWRTVPRIFLFDCCDGGEDQKGAARKKRNDASDQSEQHWRSVGQRQMSLSGEAS